MMEGFIFVVLPCKTLFWFIQFANGFFIFYLHLGLEDWFVDLDKKEKNKGKGRREIKERGKTPPSRSTQWCEG